MGLGSFTKSKVQKSYFTLAQNDVIFCPPGSGFSSHVGPGWGSGRQVIFRLKNSVPGWDTIWKMDSALGPSATENDKNMIMRKRLSALHRQFETWTNKTGKNQFQDCYKLFAHFFK